MASRRLNCWEYMKCGREPGGRHTKELGVCPAAVDASFDGLNMGKNAGRLCWAVAGTFCSGKIQGTFAEKRGSCVQCDFFKLIQREEEKAESQTKFLRFISEESPPSFLKDLGYRHIKAGERFITQGEVLDEAYIIQHGSCLVVSEKGGHLYPVRHLGVGDIVGELGLLTGEPQNAHVEAHTDMDVWILRKRHFDDLSEQDPELLDFLTELVTDRFDSNRPTGDRTIGKYVASEVIGSGGYSIVYKGFHRLLDMPVAIKMLRHNLALCPDFKENFFREARTIASFHHPNLLKVYDIEELYKTVFIIMELVEGESLEEMIQRLRAIPPPVAADLLVQICRGLAYAHGKGTLHQDINPSNILVQPGDRVKILDFGLACPIGSEDASPFDGTVHYMAPEQFRLEPVDQRTDIYALGILAYEMVTGKRPFEGENLKKVMQSHLSGNFPDPSLSVPGLPEPLRRFIVKASYPVPRQRYQHASEAAAELLPLLPPTRGKAEVRDLADPIQILVKEHALIRQFLDNLALAEERLEAGERPPREFFEKALNFIRNFADRFHHFKEEHVMFARLAQKKGGILDGPLASLRQQHERARDIVREMAESLDGYTRGDEISVRVLLEAMAGYIHLLRHHIHKEDHTFYPMVNRELSKPELEALAELFREEEQRGEGMAFMRAQDLLLEMAALLS